MIEYKLILVSLKQITVRKGHPIRNEAFAVRPNQIEVKGLAFLVCNNFFKFRDDF